MRADAIGEKNRHFIFGVLNVY